MRFSQHIFLSITLFNTTDSTVCVFTKLFLFDLRTADGASDWDILNHYFNTGKSEQ